MPQDERDEYQQLHHLQQGAAQPIPSHIPFRRHDSHETTVISGDATTKSRLGDSTIMDAAASNRLFEPLPSNLFDDPTQESLPPSQQQQQTQPQQHPMQTNASTLQRKSSSAASHEEPFIVTIHPPSSSSSGTTSSLTPQLLVDASIPLTQPRLLTVAPALSSRESSGATPHQQQGSHVMLQHYPSAGTPMMSRVPSSVQIKSRSGSRADQHPPHPTLAHHPSSTAGSHNKPPPSKQTKVIRVHGRFQLWTAGILICLALCHQILGLISESWIEFDGPPHTSVKGKDALQWLMLSIGILFGLVAHSLLISRFFGWRIVDRPGINMKLIIILFLLVNAACSLVATETYIRLPEYTHSAPTPPAGTNYTTGAAYNFVYSSVYYIFFCVLLLTYHEVTEQVAAHKIKEMKKKTVRQREMVEKKAITALLSPASSLQATDDEEGGQLMHVHDDKDAPAVTLAPPSASTSPPLPAYKSFSVILHHDYLSPPQRRFVFAVNIFFIIVYGGGLLFSYVENWNIRVASDYCIITLATIGYGNVTPKSVAGRILLFIYFPIGFASLGFAVNLIWQVTLAKMHSRVKRMSHMVVQHLPNYGWLRELLGVSKSSAGHTAGGKEHKLKRHVSSARGSQHGGGFGSATTSPRPYHNDNEKPSMTEMARLPSHEVGPSPPHFYTQHLDSQNVHTGTTTHTNTSSPKNSSSDLHPYVFGGYADEVASKPVPPRIVMNVPHLAPPVAQQHQMSPSPASSVHSGSAHSPRDMMSLFELQAEIAHHDEQAREHATSMNSNSYLAAPAPPTRKSASSMDSDDSTAGLNESTPLKATTNGMRDVKSTTIKTTQLIPPRHAPSSSASSIQHLLSSPFMSPASSQQHQQHLPPHSRTQSMTPMTSPNSNVVMIPNSHLRSHFSSYNQSLVTRNLAHGQEDDHDDDTIEEETSWNGRHVPPPPPRPPPISAPKTPLESVFDTPGPVQVSQYVPRPPTYAYQHPTGVTTLPRFNPQVKALQKFASEAGHATYQKSGAGSGHVSVNGHYSNTPSPSPSPSLSTNTSHSHSHPPQTGPSFGTIIAGHDPSSSTLTSGMTALQRKKTTTSVQLLLALLFVTVWMLGSSTVFYFTEDWTYFQAFYFCYITLTTIGYGDYYPTRSISSAFFLWFVIFGLGAVIYLLSLVAEILTQRFEERILKRKQFKKVKARKKLLQTEMEQQNIIFAPPESLMEHAEEFNTETNKLIERAKKSMAIVKANTHLFDVAELQRYQLSFASLVRAEERRKQAFEQAWMKAMKRQHTASQQQHRSHSHTLLQHHDPPSLDRSQSETDFDWSRGGPMTTFDNTDHSTLHQYYSQSQHHLGPHQASSAMHPPPIQRQYSNPLERPPLSTQSSFVADPEMPADIAPPLSTRLPRSPPVSHHPPLAHFPSSPVLRRHASLPSRIDSMDHRLSLVREDAESATPLEFRTPASQTPIRQATPVLTSQHHSSDAMPHDTNEQQHQTFDAVHEGDEQADAEEEEHEAEDTEYHDAEEEHESDGGDGDDGHDEHHRVKFTEDESQSAAHFQVDESDADQAEDEDGDDNDDDDDDDDAQRDLAERLECEAELDDIDLIDANDNN